MTVHSMFSRPTMAVSLAALSACGATTTPTVEGYVQSPNATYEELISTNVATTTLDGKTIIFSGGSVTSAPGIADVSGSLQNNTGAIVIRPNGSVTQISDADGPDANGHIVNDANGITGRFYGGYDFVRQLGGGFGQWNGYIGVETVTADIPTLGSAIFTGQANGSTTLSNSLNGNPVTITANFGPTNTGTVDISMQVTQGGSTENIDVTGMTINGSEFSGGTVVVNRDSVVQDVTSYDLHAEGTFYGYDATYNGPDEVGSVISTRGNDGGLNIVIVGG